MTESNDCNIMKIQTNDYKSGGENMRIDRVKLVSELTRQDLTQKRLAELSGQQLIISVLESPAVMK